MGFLTGLFERRQHPATDIEWDRYFGIGAKSHAGPTVTPETALTLSPYFACIRVISESVASLPLLVYRRRDDGGKERATDHPLYQLLKRRPNPEMTSFEFRETQTAHCAGWGNAYAEIEWSKTGVPAALWPLNPARMEIKRVAGELRYLYRLTDGTTANLPAWRIHHLRGLSGNGINGYSVAQMAMQSIGLGLGTEEYGARFFGNGARPGVVLRHPGKLSTEAYGRLKDSWKADHQGLSNAHRTKILEEGMDLETVGIPPEEAQFLETRKFQVVDIARWFRMPPHMIQSMDAATFGNIEHQSIDFVVHTLRPWLVRSEQRLEKDFFSAAEQETYFVEHLVDGLLRGDTTSRYNAYAIARQNGWLSVNDIRAFENMNPIAAGDEYLVPLNMVPAGQTGQQPNANTQPGSARRSHSLACTCGQCAEQRADQDDDLAEGESEETAATRRSKQKLARDFLPIYEDVAGRIVRREAADLRRALDKHLRKRSIDDFRTWLSEFYGKFESVVSDAFLATMLTYAAQIGVLTADELGEDDLGITDDLRAFIDDYLALFAQGYVASSRNQIEALITDAEAEGVDPADAIAERIDGWEETRPQKTALQQTFEVLGALTVAMYVAYGVTRYMWAASGKSCPFCTRLNGTVVGIDEAFVDNGDVVNGGPDDKPLKVRRKTRHGPLHGGCDCVVVAA